MKTFTAIAAIVAALTSGQLFAGDTVPAKLVQEETDSTDVTVKVCHYKPPEYPGTFSLAISSEDPCPVTVPVPKEQPRRPSKAT